MTVSRKTDASKLVAMAGNVVVRNQAYGRVRRLGAEASDKEYGRLRKSIHELAETAEALSKSQATAGSNPP